MFKCGFYEKEITPPLGSDVPGYFMKRFAKTVADRLYVKALAVEKDGESAILIVIDGICTPIEVYNKVNSKIPKFLPDITTDKILVCATHIHTGGPLSRGSGALDEFRTPDENYIHMVAEAAADCGILAYQKLKPATARFAKRTVEGLTFCRDYYMKDGSIRTNPGRLNPDIDRPFAKADEEFPITFFIDEDGKPIGSLSNFALHHDCKAGEAISSDFSGALARNLKAEFGNDFVSVLMSGACGNLNHVDTKVFMKKGVPSTRYLEIGRALADAAIDMYKTAEPLNVDKVGSLKDYVQLTRRNLPEGFMEEIQEIYKNVELDFSQIDVSKTDTLMYKRARSTAYINFENTAKKALACVQAIRIGDLMVYAFPGEIYTQFGMNVKEKSPSKLSMIATVANCGINCYVPTPDAFGTTIYSVQIPSSTYEIESGDLMSDALIELGKKLNN